MGTNTAISCLEELQVRTEDFDSYIERIEWYCITNDVPEAKKVAAFLSAKCMNCYATNLVAPDG